MNRCVKILPLVAIFFTLSANADVELKDNSEILGKWNLYAEAIKLDGEKKAVDSNGNLKRMDLITSATDSLDGLVR